MKNVLDNGDSCESLGESSELQSPSVLKTLQLNGPTQFVNWFYHLNQPLITVYREKGGLSILCDIIIFEKKENNANDQSFGLLDQSQTNYQHKQLESQYLQPYSKGILKPI